ncbi:MAG: methyltransferase domain-containing protein [Planctomycetota bacterium]|nr:methyltransferase domain-containing protein [Planctomycetota bacterium]
MDTNVGSPISFSAQARDGRSLEEEVLNRYAKGAKEVEAGLCCPAAHYDSRFLEVLPDEILQTDYGCGDPSRFVEAGETVVDLGSGSGKICYILAQKVGPQGRVVGVDFNPAMLALARKHRTAISHKLGYDNVRFVRARIQDMALDLEAAEAWLREHPVNTADRWLALEAQCAHLRQAAPAVADEAADVVVSNCVLNLVKPEDKRGLFAEMFRVLKRGGRAVISDIVCDEDPTPKILNDPGSWSGCISGAFREDSLADRFAQAGFYGVEILRRQTDPWQVIDGIEFRAMTIRAYKGKEGPCLERRQAVVYKGPFSRIYDDDGHVFLRGKRTAVCDKTFQILTHPKGPYAGMFEAVPPHEVIPVKDALPFDCSHGSLRDPRETKGKDFRETRLQVSGTSPCRSGTCC